MLYLQIPMLVAPMHGLGACSIDVADQAEHIVRFGVGRACLVRLVLKSKDLSSVWKLVLHECEQ